MTADFRDVLPRIRVPTLCIGVAWGEGEVMGFTEFHTVDGRNPAPPGMYTTM